jgi:hypothetical protein
MEGGTVTRTEFKEMLSSIADAWSRRDYTAAAGFFADDIHYGDPLRYTLTNRTDLQAFFEDDEGYPQRTVWHNIIFNEEQQVGAAEYTYDGTHRYHGTTLIKVRGDRISHWREYQHIDPREWEEFVGGTVF